MTITIKPWAPPQNWIIIIKNSYSDQKDLYLHLLSQFQYCLEFVGVDRIRWSNDPLMHCEIILILQPKTF